MIPYNQMFQKAKKRGIKNRSSSVPSKERITEGTRELQMEHFPQRRLQASGAYFDILTNSMRETLPTGKRPGQ